MLGLIGNFVAMCDMRIVDHIWTTNRRRAPVLLILIITVQAGEPTACRRNHKGSRRKMSVT